MPIKKSSTGSKTPARKTTSTKKAVTKKAAPAPRSTKRAVVKKSKVTRKSTASKKISPRSKLLNTRPGWVLDIPFDPSIRLLASQLGARWDPNMRCTVFRGDKLPTELAFFLPPPYSPSWHRQKELQPQSKVPRQSPSWALRPHQIQGCAAIEDAWNQRAPGFLLADDVGLGKTLSAWGFVLKQLWAKKILIVSPLSVLAHWRTTLAHIGDGEREIWIVNYDSLGKLFEIPDDLSTRAKGKRKRIAKKGEPPVFDLVIWDEAHKGKNPESARATMMRRISSKATFSLWLSATAGQEPLELSYLAPLLSRQTKTSIPEPTLKAFGEWCLMQGLGVEKGQFGHWNKTQDPQVKEAAAARLHSMLFDGLHPLALRRLPTDIAGWPELERQLRSVETSLTAQQKIGSAWSEFKKEENRSPPPKNRKKEDSSNALVRQLRLRQASSRARLESTVALTEEMLENQKQVAISVAFLDSMQSLCDALEEKDYRVSLIHGQQSATQREEQRCLFQSGQSDVMIFTVEEGISLHQGDQGVLGYENAKPRVMLIHDLRWSALQMAQIEGRCHRDGQFAPVLWLVAPNTIDAQIATIVSERVKTMKALMGDETQTIGAIQDLLYKMANASS